MACCVSKHLFTPVSVEREASARRGGFVWLCRCNPLCSVTRYKSEKASPPVGRSETPEESSGNTDFIKMLFGFTLSFCLLRHAVALFILSRLFHSLRRLSSPLYAPLSLSSIRLSVPPSPSPPAHPTLISPIIFPFSFLPPVFP